MYFSWRFRSPAAPDEAWPGVDLLELMLAQEGGERLTRILCTSCIEDVVRIHFHSLLKIEALGVVSRGVWGWKNGERPRGTGALWTTWW
jgi:hypothetical protein